MKRAPAPAVSSLVAASIVVCVTAARGEQAPEGAAVAEAATEMEGRAGRDEKARLAIERLAEVPGGRKAVPKVLTLDACLELARKKNLDLLIEANKREKARLDVASARAAFLPTFKASYTRDYDLEKDSGTLGIEQSTPWGASLSVTGNHSTDPVEQSSSSVSTTLSQDLLRGVGPASGRADLGIAEENRSAAGERFERRCQDTVFNVKRQYYDIARLMATVEVGRQAVARAARLRDEAAFKRDRGMITVLDYANSAIQLADREVALVSSERQLEDALDGLKEILDIPLGEEVAIEPVTIDLEERDTETKRTEIVIDRDAGTVSVVRTRAGAEGRPSIDVRPVFTPVERDHAALTEEARSARPDLAAARLDLAAKKLELRRKRNQLWNELKLSATYTAEGAGDAPRDSLDMAEEGWKLSLDYSWPVGRRARRADYEKAALDLATKEIEIRKLEVSAEKEIRSIARSLRETETNILTYAQKISAAAQALESARIRKERGQASYWEVTERESDLLGAQTSFINAYIDYQKRLAELDRAAGKKSGWTEAK
jgi:outer membrane protein TolC